MLLAILAAALTGCRSGPKVPAKSSEAYATAISAFYVGLAALQVGDDVRADNKLGQFTDLAPGEAAGWANWGALALRQRTYDAAAQRLERARELAPQSDHIYYLLGVLESNRGRSADAIANLRKAVEKNPQNLRAAYLLAQEIERRGDVNSDAEYQQALQKIIAAQPDNLAVLVELARAAAKRGDSGTLNATVEQIAARSSAWPAEAQEQLAALKASAGDASVAATRTTFLRNVLMRVPEYRRSLSAIKAPPGEEAQPFMRLLRMESPVSAPAAADTTLEFKAEPVPKVEGGRWHWVGAIALESTGAPVIAVSDGQKVRLSSGATLPFPGKGVPQTAESVVPIDFNYDFKVDLVLAGASGVRLFRQDSPAAFSDVTARTKLPKAVTDGSYTGAWAADIEADGDLDVVLGTRQAMPVVLRNNGDGSFAVVRPFAGVSGLTGFAWADFDGDGNPDAAIVDGSGRLHVYSNERAGQFRGRALPEGLPLTKAINVADVNNDGVLDLLAVQADGAIVRFSDKNEGRGWDVATIARAPVAHPSAENHGARVERQVRLRVADLDNNGAVDLVVSPSPVTHPSAENHGARVEHQDRARVGHPPGQSLVWLGDERGNFLFLKGLGGMAGVDAADVNGDGRLDLVGVSPEGQAVQAINRGTKNYHWQVVRPRAAQAVGDQRVNPFGMGGEIEIRSGMLVQKQPITSPQLHFGLGEQRAAEVVRVVWPNGSVSAEFEVKADQEIVTEQRLKGSCPFLFAYNGTRMEFVKDAVPWSSAIGLRINTLGTARVEATEEWYKIGREQLAPHDGQYDLRITAELWETYYYDQLALMTVDHPAGTEIFVDERFAVPPVKPAIITVATPQRIARAADDRGEDVTAMVTTLDGTYLDTFGRGQYQGVTRDHYVEVELGEDAPASRQLWLIAQGWMHPTDSSINVAIGQGSHEGARGLGLEVLDEHGKWIVAQANLGFPAGRKKICLFDLTKVFRRGAPRRVRLRTNLEIYWDAIEWAVGLPDAELKVTRLGPTEADLHYRGYSVIRQENKSSPEVPDYNRLEGSRQRWRDLSGYYTRFGDVRELLRQVDDRYVIMNSGDEMTFRFPEQPAPPAGWVRDFVIAGDGWVKDGDYNSAFSKTVRPLPYHAKNLYVTAPRRLEDEWVYRQHPEDWQTYHTRYVSAEVFQNALRNGTQR